MYLNTIIIPPNRAVTMMSLLEQYWYILVVTFGHMQIPLRQIDPDGVVRTLAQV